MTRADDAALEGLIEQRSALVDRVHNTIADGTDGAVLKPPYVVYFPGYSPDSSGRATGPEVSRRPSFTVHSVGSTAEQAQLVGEWVDAELRPGGRGVIPVVAGRLNSQIRRDVNAGVHVDRDVSPPYIYHVSEYSWGSDPA